MSALAVVTSSRSALTAAQITEFFDLQTWVATDLSEMLSQAAAFGRCAVGRVTDRESLAFDADLKPVTPAPPPTALRHAVSSGGDVWVDGWGEGPAESFLSRLAAATAVLDRLAAVPRRSEVGALDVLLDPAESAQRRSAAINRLGIRPGKKLRIVAMSGSDDALDGLQVTLSRTYRSIGTSRVGAKVLQVIEVESDVDRLPQIPVPVGARVAYSRAYPVNQVLQARTNALDAYRFTRPSPKPSPPYGPGTGVWIPASAMGGYEALCRLTREEIEEVDDIHVLDELAERHGPQILEVLEAYSSTESLRRAAAVVYMHHNTVAYWVKKAESALGYTLSVPYGRTKLFIAICLHRVRETIDD